MAINLANNLGRVSKTKMRAVTSSSGGFSPNDISGLSIWLDASDSSTITIVDGDVTQWVDKSDNGLSWTANGGGGAPYMDATQQNGLDVMHWGNGSASEQKKYTFASATGTTWTWYIVFKQDATLGTSVYTNGGNTPAKQIYLGIGTVAAQVAVIALMKSAIAQDADFHIIGCVNDNTTGSLLRHDGATTVTGINPGAREFDTFLLGGGVSGSSPIIDGRIAEVLLYDGALNTSDMGTVETYLNDKWAVY